MGGRFSRSKGIRGELSLRDALIKLGYNAYRVPLSGAASHFKGDVVAEKGAERILFELKCRAEAFKSLYAVLDSPERGGFAAFSVGDDLVAMGYDFEQVRHCDYFPCAAATPLNKRIIKLRDLLGEADYLVLKDDRKRFLFVKYC